MKRDLLEAIKHRRTAYAINNKVAISDSQIEAIIEHAVLHVPSAFNSQSARVVLLLGENHKKVWNITKDVLRKIVPPEAFAGTEAKIDGAFRAGYGTILFFEDQEVVEGMQKLFPTYKDSFPIWSQHTSAMHQYAIWLMLEDAGLGASLQHYNPIIDDEVAKTWNIDKKWKLVAQMPFGNPIQEPANKEFNPVDKRFLIFK